MKNALKKLTDHLISSPKTLFFIDSLGAFITASILLFISLFANHYFLVPTQNLNLLIAIAFCISIFGILCFLFLKSKWAGFIRILFIANLLYCALTLILMWVNFKQYTSLAVTYFVMETALISCLMMLEIYMVRRLKPYSDA